MGEIRRPSSAGACLVRVRVRIGARVKARARARVGVEIGSRAANETAAALTTDY